MLLLTHGAGLVVIHTDPHHLRDQHDFVRIELMSHVLKMMIVDHFDHVLFVAVLLVVSVQLLDTIFVMHEDV